MINLVSFLYVVTIVYLCVMAKKEMLPEYMACPIRQVISQFGDKWSLLVLYTLYIKGSGHAIRYSDIKHEMLDCSPKMLSATLKNLERIDLIHREVYAEVPPRVEYSLTPRGLSLMPFIVSLMGWAKDNFDIAASKLK